MHFFCVMAALALSSALADAAAAADGSGEQVFNNACRTCHSWKKDDNRLGPTLHGIVGKALSSASPFLVPHNRTRRPYLPLPNAVVARFRQVVEGQFPDVVWRP